MSEQNSDTKGCLGCVVVLLILVAAGVYFRPDLLPWDRKPVPTSLIEEPTEKALARVPEFLAARRVKGELLAKMREAVAFPQWDPPEAVKGPPPVGTLAGRVILWQERPRDAAAKKAVPLIVFKWHFDLEIDTIGAPSEPRYNGSLRRRKKLPHASEIRARIEAELPPTMRLAPHGFALIHREDDRRPASLHVVLPKGPEHAPVRKLLLARGLADPEATLPEVRFVVVRAVTSSAVVGRYTDGVPARRGTIRATFFLMPSQAYLGTHTVHWNPRTTKWGPLGRGGSNAFNAIRAARSLLDKWLQKTHGYGHRMTTFFPETEPVR